MKIPYSSNRTVKKKHKPKSLKIIFTLPLHLTSHRATTAKAGFWNKDTLIEGKKVQDYEKK